MIRLNGYAVTKNPRFVGRRAEWQRLQNIQAQDQARLIVVSGRRRIGKTELIEQFFQKETLLKFEGIELSPEDTRTNKQKTIFQILQCVKRLSTYLAQPTLAKVMISTWTEFFELLQEIATTRKVVLYFEEVQWLANYQADFFAEMKPFWDDHWRHNKQLTVILCGSAPSFLLRQLLSNRALYGRVQEQILLQPFSLPEIKEYLGKTGSKETMLAALTVGGIPQYLNTLKKQGTILANLCRNSFLPSSPLLSEKDKIFVSRLSHNKNYESIIELLSRRKFATIHEITRNLRGVQKSGGSLTETLADLQSCGFVERYVPLHKSVESKLVRYCISDEYLQWYFCFIKPLRGKIENGHFRDHPMSALNRRSLEALMGFNFERWCRKNAALFARILGFSGVEYESGVFFDKKTKSVAPGFQIDLMYWIKGSKIVICEIKYYEGLVDNAVCDAVKQKMELFQKSQPQYQNYTMEAVLITTEGVKDPQTIGLTFDQVITLKDIFDERYWTTA